MNDQIQKLSAEQHSYVVNETDLTQIPPPNAIVLDPLQASHVLGVDLEVILSDYRGGKCWFLLQERHRLTGEIQPYCYIPRRRQQDEDIIEA